MPILNTLLNGFRAAVGAGGRPPRAASNRPTALPPISAGEAGENRRTVDAVLKSRSDGLVPDLYAEEIATRGPAGRAYFHDFDQALRRRDPGRADLLRAKVLGRLTPGDHGAMTRELAGASGDSARLPASKSGGRPLIPAVATEIAAAAPPPTRRRERAPAPVTSSTAPAEAPPASPSASGPDRTSPVFRPDQVNRQRAADVVESLREGRVSLGTPQPISSDFRRGHWSDRFLPKDEVPFDGYRLAGESAALLAKAVRASDADIPVVIKEIRKSGMEQRSQAELIAAMRVAAEGKGLRSPSAAKREQAVNDLLEVLDWRNEWARRKAWYLFGTLGGGRGSDR